jgi:hypothetical protein
MEPPTGSALAALTPEQRRESAWTFLSTTQGRRTALKSLAELIRMELQSKGYTMEVSTNQRPARVDHVPVYAEWTVSMGGQESTQPGFSFVDVAAKSLARKLSAALAAAEPIADPVLEIIPINTVDVRKVGWAARVVSKGA